MGFILWIIIIIVYFLPTIVAVKREKLNFPAVFVVNFFLGWTFIGWVISLAWALS